MNISHQRTIVCSSKLSHQKFFALPSRTTQPQECVQPRSLKVRPLQCFVATSVIDVETRGLVSAVADLIQHTPEKSASPVVEEEAKITELTAGNLEDFIFSNGPRGLVIVDFYTDYCGPCKLMLPHYAKMVPVFKKIKFAKFNCGLPGHDAIAARHRVRSLPTFKLYSGGRPMEEVTGGNPVKLRQMLIHYNR